MEHGVPGLNRRPDFELAHIGVNASNSENAKRIADDFCQVFDRSIRAGESSVFVGKEIEVMRGIGRGTCGHIALATPCLLYTSDVYKRQRLHRLGSLLGRSGNRLCPGCIDLCPIWLLNDIG